MRRTENDTRRMSILPYPRGFKTNRRGKYLQKDSIQEMEGCP
jgi:hypothetical protein